MGIKVLHIVPGSINGGAAKGVIFLHKYLLKLGVESIILTDTDDRHMGIKNVFYYKKNYYEKFIYYSYKLVFRIIFNLFFFKKFIFTSGFYGVNLKKNKLFNEADIIHIHMMDNFVSLNTIKNIKKPIVWTLRDWWIMRGGYHLRNFHKFDQNKSWIERNISSFLFKINKKFVINKKNIHFIAISDRIKKDFEETYDETRIDRIYNLTDQENFYPENQDNLKKSLNINTSKKIILFGSSRISDPYKGSEYLESILSKLDPKLYFIISFGVNDRINLSKYNFEHINFGEINNNNELRKIYSVSNLFLCTSVFESFGKTVLESLLCSTPVVAFDVGAVNEIIVDRKNGYLAKPFDIDDFILGINFLLNKEKEFGSSTMIKKRLEYLEPFSHKKIPKLYLDLYNKIFSKN
jgi:glycosyltransferase involved in cell wall biosynthesis